MVRINLLPWREARRQARQQQFYQILIVAVILALAAFYLAMSMVNGRIDTQKNRNAYLQQEIAKVDKVIREIADLEVRREQLIARIQVIQELQESRPKVVRVLDSLVRTVPEGIHLETVTRQGEVLTVQGVAQSNPRVSVFMQQIDQDAEFAEAKLKVVERSTSADDAVRQFTLDIEESQPELAIEGTD